MKNLIDWFELAWATIKSSWPLIVTFLGAMMSAFGAFKLAYDQNVESKENAKLYKDIAELTKENNLETKKNAKDQEKRSRETIDIQLELIKKNKEQKDFAEKAYLDQQESNQTIQSLSSEIIKETTETCNRITSKESFCFLRVGLSNDPNGPPGRNNRTASIVVIHSGKYPIRNVRVSLVNSDQETDSGFYDKNSFNEDPEKYHKSGYPYVQAIPVLMPNQKIQLPNIDIVQRKQKSFNVYFTSDNDFWFQRIMLRDLKEFGMREPELVVNEYRAILQVYRQDLSESLNQVYRHETIIREGQGWDSDGYIPEKNLYKIKDWKSYFPFVEGEGSLPVGRWMYSHWNGNYLENSPSSIYHYLSPKENANE